MSRQRAPGERRRARPADGVGYAQVGGLRDEVRRVREAVELPLRCPRVFARLGIVPPRGVLLFGPPGTGKTLLARAVAHETGIAFLSVSGPEVMHKLYGESEARLRALFEEARDRAPSIVFIDEIDALAPRREAVVGQVEKRVVAQLLALMDGLRGRQVVVIAATNLPELVDPALRRPGRFDREIQIRIPDAGGRLEIFAIHARGMPLAADVDLSCLAAMAHGFVGADIEAACREAAMVALRAALPDLEAFRGALPEERIGSLRVTMRDFQAALAGIVPSALREVAVEVPHVRWSDVGGLDGVKRELQEAVLWRWRHADLVRRLDLRPARGILLHGPPGNGKTLLARALASEAGVNFVSVKGPALLSKYVGESERAVREVFRKARQAAPCVLFFDEVDALAPARGLVSHDGQVGERVTGQLLTELDGLEETRGVLVLAASNRVDRLDAALLRAGRFDLLLEVPPPDAAARARIFEAALRRKPLAERLDATALAGLAGDFSGADVDLACRRAALFALRRYLAAGGEGHAAPLAISRADLVAAIEETRQARHGEPA